jgi:hypothetical protein
MANMRPPTAVTLQILQLQKPNRTKAGSLKKSNPALFPKKRQKNGAARVLPATIMF